MIFAVTAKGERKMPRYIDVDNVKLKGISVFDQNLEILIPLSDVRKSLQMTPTADVVEVKYGYWEIVKGSNGKEKMVCTNCRHQQDLHGTFTYCPNCGALIDGRVIHNG